MKLLCLRFANIHSLSGEQVIDFTKPPLSQTGIIAITGPTGAGKSTILDAITLALYGKISRLGGSVSSTMIAEFGGVVTRGQKEAFAELTYQINDDVYTSTWIYKSGKKQMILLCNGEAVVEKEQEVSRKNVEIIGLTYEQFVRAVILPQGEFANFLKADSDERVRILEKITGGEIYRILGRMAFEIKRQKENELEKKKAEIESIELLTAEEIKELKEALQKKKSIVVALADELKELNERLALKKRISQQETELADARRQLKDVQAQWETLKNDFDRLQMHERLMRYRHEIRDFLTNKKEKSNLEKEIESIQKQVEQIQGMIKEKQKRRRGLEEKLADLHTAREELKPKIAKVRELDGQLIELNTKIEELKEQIKKLTEEEQKTKKHISLIAGQLEHLGEKYVTITQWLEKNKLLSDLKQNIPLINNNIEAYKTKGKHVKQKAEDLGYEVKNWEQLRRNIDADLASYNQFLLEVQPGGEAADFNRLNAELEQQRQRLKVLEQILEKTHFLEQKNIDLNTVKQEYAEAREQAKVMENRIKQLEQSLSEKQKQRGELEERRLSQQEILVLWRARQMLKEGQPCPVCGSIHHPYKHEELEVKVEDFSALINDLDKEIQQLQTEQLKLRSEYSMTQVVIQEKHKQSQVFEKELDDVRDEIQALATEITMDKTDMEILEQEIKKTQERIGELTKKIGISQKILESKHMIEALQSLSQVLEDVMELHARLDTIRQSYSAYVSSAIKLEEFRRMLNNLATQYDDYEQEKTKIETDKAKLQTQLSMLKTRLEETERDKKKYAIELQEYNNKYNVIKHSRFLLFEDKEPDKVLEQYDKQIQNITDALTELREELSKLQSSLIEKQNNLEDKGKKLQCHITELVQIGQRLLPILNKLGIDTVEAANELFLTDEQYDNLQNIKQNVEKKQVLIKQIIRERDQKLEELLKKDDETVTVGGLQRMIKEKETQRDELNRQIGYMQQKLDKDEQNKQIRKQLREEYIQMEQEYLRWKMLEEEIGMADGSRFQRIAQEFSMNALVSSANFYLRKFTDRYQLVVESNERKGRKQYALFVVDNYLAGQRRSVSTLSGGESFIVSLSLAIGLSSLASQKVLIGNIFIDEGFGSLDTDTLDQALAVLERFQSDTNRKIAIISHVEALKERIPVKIQVIRVEQGVSKINIVVH